MALEFKIIEIAGFKLHQKCVHPEQVAIIGDHRGPYGYYGSTVEDLVEDHMLRCLHCRMLNQKGLPTARFTDEIQKLLKIGIEIKGKPLRQQMDPKKKPQLLESVSSSGRGNTQEVALGCKEDEIVFKQHVFPVSMPVAKYGESPFCSFIVTIFILSTQFAFDTELICPLLAHKIHSTFEFGPEKVTLSLQ